MVKRPHTGVKSLGSGLGSTPTTWVTWGKSHFPNDNILLETREFLPILSCSNTKTETIIQAVAVPLKGFPSGAVEKNLPVQET